MEAQTPARDRGQRMDVRPSREQIEAAYALAGPCMLCPRACGTDRPSGESGRCGIGALPLVASVGPHFGEEPCLVGSGGSGTIFLSGCNLLCAFCQNHDISHGRAGRAAIPLEIAGAMLALQRRGCENVNFVTPTHVTPWLMEAVRRARLDGLTVPVVYNCGGYERAETLRLLEDTVDIYMPDAKFWDPDVAARYTGARDYPERMCCALKEMHRQVGDLEIVEGVARRGLLVRHLVMPNGVAGSRQVLRFLAEEVSPRTCVNVMEQYRPLYHARRYPEIARPITDEEYAEARLCAEGLGLRVL
jgi:putative pyruvate formate lyase activating enzyme